MVYKKNKIFICLGSILIILLICFFNIEKCVFCIINLLSYYSFHGVILIERNNQIIFQQSYLNKPINRQQFLCGSLVKQITSVLILQEVSNGRIELNKKANQYLQPSQKIDEKITIHQLLSHISGIQKNAPVKFEPGSKYEYSNYGYVILGYILENVTQQCLDEIASNLFKKYKMADTFLVDAPTPYEIQKKHPDFLLASSKVNNRDFSKTTTFSYVTESDKNIFFANAGGGLISTACDLLKWNYQLHNQKILQPKLYEKITTPVIKSNFPEVFYCYGICSDTNEKFHIGYVGGYVSTLSYFPKQKISLVILENASWENVGSDFRKHLWIRKLIKNFIN